MLAGWIKERFQVATVRACRLARFSRAGFYRKSTAKDQSALRLRIREIAHARPRFGYQRIRVMLRREGWPVNKKRVRRLYRLDGLQLRTRIRRRKHICLHRGPVPVPSAPHERWRSRHRLIVKVLSLPFALERRYFDRRHLIVPH